MFGVKFDDYKRKLAAKPVSEFPYALEKLETCQKGSSVFDEWFAKFMSEDSDIHITIEDDNVTYTFFKIIPRET